MDVSAFQGKTVSIFCHQANHFEIKTRHLLKGAGLNRCFGRKIPTKIVFPTSGLINVIYGQAQHAERRYKC